MRYEKSRQRLLAELREERARYVAETEAKHARSTGEGDAHGCFETPGSLAGWLSKRRWDAGATPEADRLAFEASFGGFSSVAGDAGELRMEMLSVRRDATDPRVHADAQRRAGTTSRRKLVMDVPQHLHNVMTSGQGGALRATKDDEARAAIVDAEDEVARALRREERRHRRKMSALRKAETNIDRTIASEQRARDANLAVLKRQSRMRIAASAGTLVVGGEGGGGEAVVTLDRAGHLGLERTTIIESRNHSSHLKSTAKLRQSLPPEQELELCKRVSRLSMTLDKELRAAERSRVLAERQRLREAELAAQLAQKAKRGELVRVRRAESAAIGQQLGKACTAFREARRAAERGRGDFARAAAEAANRSRLENAPSRPSSAPHRMR